VRGETICCKNIYGEPKQMAFLVFITSTAVSGGGSCKEPLASPGG
jgi:hypothetical protein